MTSDPHVDGASGELIVLDQRAARASGEHRSRQTRGLSTANAVLKVLAFMTQHPEGVSARQVADELGKSVSTAYYLLASLLEEGFADHQQGRLYRLRADAPLGPARPHPAPDDALLHAADDLFDRTHRRTYIGCVQAGAIVTTATRGRQGIPRIRGLGTRIGRNAHALAIGKVVLSLLSDRGRRRDVDGGLPSYTTRTITSAEVLLADPEVVERDCEQQGVSGGEFVGQCGGDGFALFGGAILLWRASCEHRRRPRVGWQRVNPDSPSTPS